MVAEHGDRVHLAARQPVCVVVADRAPGFRVRALRSRHRGPAGSLGSGFRFQRAFRGIRRGALTDGAPSTTHNQGEPHTPAGRARLFPFLNFVRFL